MPNRPLEPGSSKAKRTENKVRRIVVGLDPRHRPEFDDLVRIAADLQAELLGLFIEDEDLLRFAGLPTAREIGFPSGLSREVDRSSIERTFRLRADALKRQCAQASLTRSVTWSFRVTRGAPAEQYFAVVSERHEATLLLPPGCSVDIEPVVVRADELSTELLRQLLAGSRPVLIEPNPP